MIDCPPQSPDLNPIKQILGELENKLDRSIFHSNESLWLELQKAWDNISVEVLRKYIDTMPETCAALIAVKGGQILKLKVDKTHFISNVLCWEQPSACFMNIMKWNHFFGGEKGEYFQICQVF